jgi:hypothetical protein
VIVWEPGKASRRLDRLGSVGNMCEPLALLSGRQIRYEDETPVLCTRVLHSGHARPLLRAEPKVIMLRCHNDEGNRPRRTRDREGARSACV